MHTHDTPDPAMSETGSLSFRWPSGHATWIFSGASQFQGGATSFLAEGYAKGERLMLIADDPRKDLWPDRFIDEGLLVIASTSEIYGDDPIVDAGAQRATFADVLATALRDGYLGVRVVADNTSLIQSDTQLEAWMLWEEVADQLWPRLTRRECAFVRKALDELATRRREGRPDGIDASSAPDVKRHPRSDSASRKMMSRIRRKAEEVLGREPRNREKK